MVGFHQQNLPNERENHVLHCHNVVYVVASYAFLNFYIFLNRYFLNVLKNPMSRVLIERNPFVIRFISWL